jgi:hypothetical protein
LPCTLRAIREIRHVQDFLAESMGIDATRWRADQV